MLKLYDYFRSSAAFRTRFALNYKSLGYEKIAIDLYGLLSNPREIKPLQTVTV